MFIAQFGQLNQAWNFSVKFKFNIKMSGAACFQSTKTMSPHKDLNTSQELAYRVRHATSKIDTGNLGAEDLHTGPPLDYSYYSIGSFKDIDLGWDYIPREHVKKVKQRQDGKFETTILKLNNNLLQKWDGFDGLVSLLLTNPSELSWIDLSINYIVKIDKVLLKYTNIKILYLHGNTIEKLSEVDKLARLKNLRNLTLHGNPIESEPGYRQYVVKKLPQLKTLDFSGITKGDRAMAAERIARRVVCADQNAAGDKIGDWRAHFNQ